MNRVHVLDCTLRDGGYCNNWMFGFDNTKKIVKSLVDANINIIECGFLTERVEYNPNVTKFAKVEEVSKVIPKNRNGKIFVVMMNYGEFNIDNLPAYDGSSIDGIRIAFHKKDLKEALELSKSIKAKGYKVFIQPMVSLSYEDKEFLDLIHMVNDIDPYAFYIVDSFGMMKQKDLIRMFYMVEHNLKERIWIGFHSHNNMQLAYSNAQSLVDIHTSRNLIMDSSVYGMGRGAGNLNTELFVEYLNENVGGEYILKPLLNIIDEILNEFYQKNYWGYSLPNYLSASHNLHPNYASYLDDKKTLTVEAIDEIFKMMDIDKKLEFDKKYIESLYLNYMGKENVEDNHINELKNKLEGKKVLLIAPGKSALYEKEKISLFSKQKDVVVVSINMDYKYADTDFIFLSNLRRFRELEKEKRKKCIVTSNISADNIYLQYNYQELINEEEAVKDNAGMMAIKFFIKFGVEYIYLAGFDGYSHDITENYVDSDKGYITRNAVLDNMNDGIKKVLKDFEKKVKIQYLTDMKYIYL